MITIEEVLWGVAGFLIGGFVGHRLALGRERRKEFNELADKLFLNVDVKLEEHDAHHFCIKESDVKLIRRRMWWFKKRMFDKAMARYNEAARDKYTDRYGQIHYSDPIRVTATLQGIAKCLGRK